MTASHIHAPDRDSEVIPCSPSSLQTPHFTEPTELGLVPEPSGDRRADACPGRPADQSPSLPAVLSRRALAWGLGDPKDASRTSPSGFLKLDPRGRKPVFSELRE